MALKHIRLPDLGEGVTEGEIIKVKVSLGEKISMDQILVEVMTDKASMEVPSSIEGTIQKLEVKEGDIVPVGGNLFLVESDSPSQKLEGELENKAQAIPRDSKKLRDKQEKTSKFDKKFLVAPSTRKLAEELGLSLEHIKGQGAQGEILREDLLQYVKSRLGGKALPSFEAKPLSPFEGEKRESLRGIKRLMFENMTLSKATIPHFTIGEQARVEYLVNIREEMKERLGKQGLKVGYLPFFIKALIPVLKEFPLFNSVYDPQSKEIVFKKVCHIGFAVDSPDGLLVPVLKQAQTKSLLTIIKETQSLAEKARQGQLQRESLTGSGITLSNLGSLAGFYGTPIINPPEMAIIGIYSLFKKIIKNKRGEFEEKPFINFSLTCDHRFIDGATAARFLKSFVNKMEEPSLLLLE